VDQCGQAADRPSRVFRCRRPRETSSPTSRAIPHRVRLASRSSPPLGVAALAFAAPSTSFLRPRGITSDWSVRARYVGVSAIAGAAAPAAARTAPTGLGPSQGFIRVTDPRPAGPGYPLLGFMAPSTAWACRSRIIPGFSSPGSFRLRGFTPPWRFAPCTLCGLAAAAIPGVPQLKGPFVRSPRRVAAAHASHCRRCSCIPNSEEYEVRNFATPIR